MNSVLWVLQQKFWSLINRFPNGCCCTYACPGRWRGFAAARHHLFRHEYQASSTWKNKYNTVEVVISLLLTIFIENFEWISWSFGEVLQFLVHPSWSYGFSEGKMVPRARAVHSWRKTMIFTFQLKKNKKEFDTYVLTKKCVNFLTKNEIKFKTMLELLDFRAKQHPNRSALAWLDSKCSASLPTIIISKF